MQIGNEQLDAVCDEAIDPAIRDAGFAARRVDRHNEGDLLKSEIVKFIERSQIIVADVTNARPNCYLEIGYAMGLGKKANLILTAREDHHHTSPNFKREGPKIHFDLEGYSILFWDPSELSAFRRDLTRLIQRRAAILRPKDRPNTDEPDWREALRGPAETGLASVGRSAYMEIAADLRPQGSWSQARLRDVLRESSIDTFGWPIALMLENGDEYRPRPTTDGITAEVAIAESDGNPFGQDRRSYDYWKLFGSGRFYTLLSLFEDERAPGTILLEVRITRVTEALLLLARIYRRLDASDTDQIIVRFRHSGLAGRGLAATDRSRDRWGRRKASEDVVESSVTTSLAGLESDLVAHVKEIIDPLFVIFEFFELSDVMLENIVNEFVAEVR